MVNKRLPWGHQSRHCVQCGQVGPRCWSDLRGGYMHKYCMTPQERKAYEAQPGPMERLAMKQRESSASAAVAVRSARTRG